MTRPTDRQMSELYNALLSLQNEWEMKAFLEDLCTTKEMEQMSARFHAAKMLKNGATYNEAIEASGLSSATISRVSHCVQYGEGYNLVLEKQEEKNE